MALKTIYIEGIGPVLLAKRRGTKNIRLSVRSDGQVRVGLPAWLPYSAGVKFAEARSDWIRDHQGSIKLIILKPGDKIGKSRVLSVVYNPRAERFSSRMTQTEIRIITPFPPESPAAQAKIRAACERALKQEAQNLLPARLDALSSQHNLKYKNVRIVKLKSRWGSCSTDQIISLSYYLIQLPWHLIDYVLIHELLHTQHLNHGPDFWARFDQIIPAAKQLKKDVRAYPTTVVPF